MLRHRVAEEQKPYQDEETEAAGEGRNPEAVAMSPLRRHLPAIFAGVGCEGKAARRMGKERLVLNELFPMIDAALASAAERSGEWLACRPGCHQCCVGVFAISALDAAALRDGLATAAPDVRERVLARAEASRARLAAMGFPGDAATGVLFTEPGQEEQFEEFANDEPCPVLDPATGTCDLYAHRPVQCRTFGPPVRDEEGALTVCELCFVGAPEEEVARCEMDQGWRGLEQELIEGMDAEERLTVVAFALRQGSGAKVRG
jgi:Fe-S-cluster containining protein